MSENQLSAGVLEKNKLFEDVFDGKVPERVPRLVFGDNAFCLEYAGYDLRKEQYSLAKNLDAIDIATKDFDSDVVFGMFLRMPHLYKMLEAINFVMGTDGFIQHPEVQGLKDDEYDDFIADPIKTLWDKVLPRLYPALAKPGFEGQKALSKAFYTFFTSMGVMQQGFGKIAEKYDKSVYSMAPAASCTPLDILSDQLRSFSGISTDMRRRPDKVEAACNALLPVAIKAGSGPNANRYVRTFIPLHMAPYMREKDFKRFYWPTFKAYVEALDAQGIGANLFVENDWMRYLDYLNELPPLTHMSFEFGDPKLIAEKVGKRHVISGLYPLTLLKTGTEQECIDKAKELIDILAPGGQYIFALDKNLLKVRDINPENLKAVLNFVKEYGKY